MSDHISETVSAGQLRSFVERIERVEEEIKELNADKSDIYKEVRSAAFDVKAVRQCVAARKLDSAEREERNAIFDLYWAALTGSPSRVHVHEAKDDAGSSSGRTPDFGSGNAGSNPAPVANPPSPAIAPSPAGEADDVPLVASSAPFTNPRCIHPDTCSNAHKRDTCFDCSMAWAKRPKEEQVMLWQQAVEASRTQAA